MSWRFSGFPNRSAILQYQLKARVFRQRYVTSCAQILAREGHDTAISSDQEVTVFGHVHNVRKHKKYAFAHITDGSTIKLLQAVLSPEQAADLTNGTAVQITGHKTSSPGRGQEQELKATHVKLIGSVEDPAKKQHTDEFFRSIPHLRLRTPFNSLLVRFRSECIDRLTQTLRDFPRLGRFTQVHPPILTSSDCEGAGQVFTIGTQDAPPRHESATPDAGDTKAKDSENYFFRSPAYLTVSTQLHLEAYSAALGNVWTISPTFRAERSDTVRHLAEFYMLEAEFQYLASLSQLMDLLENMIRSLVTELRNSTIGQEMLSSDSESTDLRNSLQNRWSSLDQSPRWPRITYRTALDMIVSASEAGKASFSATPSWDSGFNLEHEKYLVEAAGSGSPIFVTDYPRSQKPFYMAPSTLSSDSEAQPPEEPHINADGDTTSTASASTVANFDLLFPHSIGEVAGGSLREHRLPSLLTNMRRAGMIKPQRQPRDPNPSSPTTTMELPSDSGSVAESLRLMEEQDHPLRWYVDLRKYGSAPHGGFGLGFDRLIAYLTGRDNVRDVVGWPRVAGRRAEG
ncbi:MAG: hypothetical protein Q9160_000270 [Pyrenula sp. 1 TL-2023]